LGEGDLVNTKKNEDRIFLFSIAFFLRRDQRCMLEGEAKRTDELLLQQSIDILAPEE